MQDLQIFYQSGEGFLHTRELRVQLLRELVHILHAVNGQPDKAAIAIQADIADPGPVEKSLRDAAIWDEVKDKLKKPGTALSGGQQQRLCIARAIAIQPEVLLMDEPTSAIDPIGTSKIEDLIGELKKSFTVVIVTHNMQQAARVSDYTAFFYKGVIVEYGKTQQLFTKPGEKKTEDYITGRFG